MSALFKKQRNIFVCFFQILLGLTTLPENQKHNDKEHSASTSSANLTDNEIMAGYRQTSSKWIQTGISESYTYNHASPPL